MRSVPRRSGRVSAVAVIVVALVLGIYAQDQFAVYVLVIDKAGVPVLDIKPSDISIQEAVGPGTIAGVSRFGWPLKLTVLVDNGPGTSEALVPLRNGLNRLFEGIPRDVPVSLIATAPNPRWLIRESKDLVQLRNAVGRLAPDDGLARFSDALGEYAARLDREFTGNEEGLPPYLPVLISIATTHADGSDVLCERNERMLLSLRKHRVWTHMIMVTPGRRVNEPGDVSNLDADEGQNGEIAQWVQLATGGSYMPVSSGATNALATNILAALARQIALRYLKQMTQHRVVFHRAAGVSGPMKNLELTIANHPGSRVVVSTDGSMP